MKKFIAAVLILLSQVCYAGSGIILEKEIETGTATGQMTYWDNTSSQWKHTETTELSWDDALKQLLTENLLVTGSISYGGNQTQYVNCSTGSDTTGDGSVGNPYATIGKALSFVPYEVTEKYQILVANGTCNESFDSIEHVYSPSGQLTIDGYQDAVNYAGPFTVTTANTLGVLSGTAIDVSGAGWTTDDFYGKFIKLTTGASAGTVYPIYTNDSDTIVTNAYFTAVSGGDQFYVVQPGITVNLTAPILLNSSAPSSYYASHFGVSNVLFDYTGTNPIVIAGDGPVLFPVVIFRKNSGQALEIQGGNINSSPLFDSSGFTNSNYAAGYKSGSVVQIGTAVPSTASDIVRVSTDGGVNTGVNMGYFVARNGVNITARSGIVQFSQVDHVIVDHSSYGNVIFSYINTKTGYTNPGIRLDDFSVAEIEGVYFGNSAVESIRGEDGVRTFLDNVSGVTGPTYGMRLRDTNDLLIGSNGVTLTGTSGDVFIEEFSKVVSWPAASKSLSTIGDMYADSIILEQDLELTGGGSITTTANGDITLLPNGTGITVVGDSCTTSHGLDSNQDQLTCGESERDGVTYFDAYWQTADDVTARFGSGSGDVYMSYNTIQTPDAFMLGIGTDSRNVIIAETGDFGFDFAHPQSLDPTLIGHSANQSTSEYWSITNNQTDSVLESGTGLFRIDAPSGVMLMDGGGNALLCQNDGTKTTVVPNAGDYLRVGDTCTSSRGLSANNSLLICGASERDGVSYFDAGSTFGGDLTLEGGIQILIAGGGDIRRSIDDGLMIAPNGVDGQSNNNLIITDANYKGKDHDHDTYNVDPHVFIQGGVDPDTDNTKWMSLYYDTTNDNGVIDVGTGVLNVLDGILTSSFNVAGPNPSIDLTDTDTTDDDVNFKISANATATGSGAEDVDVFFETMASGSLYEFINVDASAGVGGLGYARFGGTKATGAMLAYSEVFSILDSAGSFYSLLTYSADDGMLFSVGEQDNNGNRHLIFTNVNYYNKDHDHDVRSDDLTIFLHSNTDPDTDNTQWGSLTHDKSNFVLAAGTGGVKIDDDGIVSNDLTVDTSTLHADSTDNNVGMGTSTPNAAALLDMVSTSKGFAPPRMTNTQILAITSPIDGLRAHSTDDDMLFVYDSGRTKWLSAEVTALQYGGNGVADGEYMSFGGIMNATGSGARMPLDGTIVRVTTQTSGGEATKGFEVQINDVSQLSYSLSSNVYTNNAVNVNFSAGDYIHNYVVAAGLSVNNPATIVWVKWRP
ncbi:MAG: hypothetical protein GWN93_27010 [Deltaproteobacteria bacterium]|nr:hypothetical protein [Deltaproteobacteria bacterium]